MSEQQAIAVPENVGRILLVKPSSIGDVVHALPVWQAVRDRWPQAQISWLVSPACANLIEGLPGLELILFERKKLGEMWKRPAAVRELLAFQRLLREKQFDLVLDLQGLFRSGWFARCTGAKARVGFANAREMAWLFYTDRVPLYTMEQHAVRRNLQLAQAVGCEVSQVRFPLPITEADRAVAADLCGAHESFALLCPGANWLTKRWPPERFAALAGELRANFGLRSLVAGGPGDAPLGELIEGAANLCGRTTLRRLAALMERASLVVTNDSGPMHIAAALHRPLVAVFGPTNPVRTGPFLMESSVVTANVDCAPCYQKHCANCRCIERVKVHAVVEAAEGQLRRACRLPATADDQRRSEGWSHL